MLHTGFKVDGDILQGHRGIFFGFGCSRFEQFAVDSPGIKTTMFADGYRWITDADFDPERGRFVGRSEDIYLLRVQTNPEFRLPLRGHSPQFRNANIWIGADGEGLQEMYGGLGDPYKDQLFRLKPFESVLVFDADKRVVKVTIAPGQKAGLVFEQAIADEIAEYAVAWALKKGGKNRSAIGWARSIIDELKVPSHHRTLDQRFGRPRAR